MDEYYDEEAAEYYRAQLLKLLPDSGWLLANDGTLDVLLECVECGHIERFADLGSLCFFIEDGESCPDCGPDREWFWGPEPRAE